MYVTGPNPAAATIYAIKRGRPSRLNNAALGQGSGILFTNGTLAVAAEYVYALASSACRHWYLRASEMLLYLGYYI